MKRTTCATLLFAIAVATIGYRSSHGDSIESCRSSEQPINHQRPDELTVRFLGTTTLLFDDGETALMTDAFFSRPSWLKVLFGKIEPDCDRITYALNEAKAWKLDAIFVAHSHHDHAMDTGTVSAITGGLVYGSASTGYAVESTLPKGRFRLIKDGYVFKRGKFTVTVLETPHSLDAKLAGTIDHSFVPPARASAYRGGENFSFLVQHDKRTMLVVPSGNYTPGKFQGIRAETVFLGIGTLGKQSERFFDSYWYEAVTTPRAEVVVPIHWDDLGRPLHKPLRSLPWIADDVDTSRARICRLSQHDGVKITWPTAFFESISLAPEPR